jgi:hypothetical protein
VGERVRAGLQVLAELLQQCDIPPALASARALDAYIQVEGAMVLARTLDDLEVFRRVVRRLPDQLLAAPGPERLTISAVTGTPTN